MSARPLAATARSETQAADRESATSLARTCACGAQTFGASECDACRAERAQDHARAQVRPLDRRAVPATPPSTAPSRPHIVLHVDDVDPERAARTRDLLLALAAQFGLRADAVHVRVDAEAARRTAARHATGLAEGRVAYLRSDRYDPRSGGGRYLLAHEVAHVAQHEISGPLPLSTAAPRAEIEAHAIANAFASGRLAERPHVAIPPSFVAADSDVAAIAPEESLDKERRQLDAVVARAHAGELRRIHRLLSYNLLDWAITDEDVRKVLTILQAFEMVAARSLVAALTRKDRDRLLDNLDTPHYKNQREQVLAVYWGTPKAELEPFSGDLVEAFQAMDLKQLQPLEAAAAAYAVEAMNETSRRALLDSARGAVVREITTRAREAKDELLDLERDQIKKAAGTEQKALEERTAAQRAFDSKDGGDELRRLVAWIKQTLDKTKVWDADALAILDALAPFGSSPAKLRAIADHLVEVQPIPAGEHAYLRYEEKDYLDELIDQTPIQALYVEGDRRRVFFRLLTFRPAYKNEALAEALVDTPWYDVVTSEDAFLAYQLVKAMPEAARKSFYQSKGGANWSMVQSKLSLQQRESESMNLYTGGKEDKDRQSIQVQLLDDAVWTAKNAKRLDALVRMAVAAGEHRFVFDQSEYRQAYRDPDLRKVVDKYLLFNPTAKDPTGRPRDHYDPEALKGTPWYREGFFGDVEKGAQFIDFVFSSDDVEVATRSIGGKGLDLAELQDAAGGSLGGVRLKRREELPAEKTPAEKAAADKGRRRVNTADVRWDLGKGLLEAQADHLEIAAIRMPFGDATLQAAGGTVRDFRIRLKYALNDKPDPAGVEMLLGLLRLDDLLWIKPDEMYGANLLDLQALQMRAGASGAKDVIGAKPRGGMKVPVPVLSPILGTLANVFSLTGVKVFGAELVKSSAAEIGEVMKPTLPMEFDITFASLKLSGITTSAGLFMESMDISDFSAHGGGDVGAYRTALVESLERLTKRLAEEQAKKDKASPDQAETYDKSIRALTRQIAATETELRSLAEDEREVARLEANKVRFPQAFTAEDRKALRRLKARLSGIVLDARSVRIGGLAASSFKGVSAEIPEDLPVSNVHGMGRSAGGGLALLDSATLTGFVAGEERRPAVSGLAEDRATFSLDVGDFTRSNVKIRGAIPSLEDARKEYDAFAAKYEPWRKSHQDELARLDRRVTLARDRDELLANPGLSRLNRQQSKRFSELTRELEALEAQAETTIGRIEVEGLLISSGDTGTAIGAERLEASAIERGGLRIRSIEGDRVRVGVDLTRGGPELRFGGERLDVGGIQDSDTGLEIERAAVLGVDEAKLSKVPGNVSARLKTQLVYVVGVHLRRLEADLIAERDYLASLATRTPKQDSRLAAITGQLAEKAKLAGYVAAAEKKLAAAKTKGQKQRAKEARDAAQRDLDRWAEGLITESVLVEQADLEAKVGSAGFEIAGRGGPTGRRLFAGATVTGVSVPGTSAGRLTFGETSGRLVVGEKGTLLDHVGVTELSIEDFEWHDGARRAYARGVSTLSGIEVTGFMTDDQVVVSELTIASIAAADLGYEDASTGLSIVVESGALQGIRAVNLTIDLPKTAGEKPKISSGTVGVQQLQDVRFRALVKGLKAKGRLSGTGLSVDFVSDLKRVYSVKDLTLEEGEVTKPGTSDRIHVTLKRVHGTVTEEALESGETKYTLAGIGVGDAEVGKSRWTDGKRTIEIDEGKLHNVTFDGEVVRASEKAGGGLKSLRIIKLGIESIKATTASVVDEAMAPDPKKPGDTGRERRVTSVDNATILGLEVAGLDLMKDLRRMEGTVRVKNTIDVQNLSVKIGEKGRETLTTTLSVKLHGKESKGEGLGGRELRATILGKDGIRLEVGTIEKVSGDLALVGATKAKTKTGFGTGRITMSPIEIAADGSRVAVSDIEIADVSLTGARYEDAAGTVIQLSSADSKAAHLKNVVATFGELTDEKGKKSEGLKTFDIKGLTFDPITARGFDYTGTTTLSGSDKQTTHLTATSAELKDLELTSLSSDFATHVTRLDAKLGHADVTRFAATLTETLAGKKTETEVVTDVHAGAMHAFLTLTGTKTGGKDWTSIDGLFEMTDPKAGLGLTNMRVTRREDGKEVLTLGILDPAKTGGFDLTGLKVNFAPNGTLLVRFDDLAAKNLKLKAGAATIDIPLGELKKGAIALQGLAPGQAFDVLGANLAALEVSGVKVTYEGDRSVPSAGVPIELWKLDPLRRMSGTVRARAFDVPVIGTVDVPVPITNGWINFDEVSVHKGGVPLVPMGIDEKGIYADIPPRYHVYEGQLPGTILEAKNDYGAIVHRGSINVARLVEGTLNAPSKPGAPADLSGLNKLQVETQKLQLGGGDIAYGPNSVTLSGKAVGKNEVTITGARLGTGFTISIPEFEARRSEFTFAGKKGDTGMMTASMKVTISGLGSAATSTGALKFTITVDIEKGNVGNIHFGDVSLVASPAALRARPLTTGAAR